MDSREFAHFRKRLNKTQAQLAQLLGTSVKTIHSYEQGWRFVPTHIERQMYFLATKTKEKNGDTRSCWVINECTAEQRERCPAWEFQAGQLCWFINGTICKGKVQKDWNEKMKMCRKCSVLTSQL